MASAESTALEFQRRGYTAFVGQLSDGTSCTVGRDPDGKIVALEISFDNGAPGIPPRAHWLPRTTQFKNADTDTSELVDAIIATIR